MKIGYIIGLLAIMIFIGCEKEDSAITVTPVVDVEDTTMVDVEDTSIVIIDEELSFLEDFDITNREIDFQAGETTVFTAQLSAEVDWEVNITGLETGAIKSIAGFSSGLDISNATWEGTTTELPLFNIETCAVEFRIPSDTILILDTLEVVGNIVNSGFIVADFENGMNPDWTSFVQSGNDMSFNITNDVIAGQGENYYDMGGEVSWDWLLGLLDFPATAYGSNTFELNPDPEAVYFNVMLYLPPNINNEIVLFQFKEDDNADGVYAQNDEDMFSIEVNNNLDPGWQLISIRYADIPTLINGSPATPIGNGIYEPNKLSEITVLMLANPTSGYSQTLMDYLIFTEGGPLNP